MTDKKTIIHVGGSIEQAARGDYQIHVKSVLAEAWQKTKNNRKVINLAILVVTAIAFIAISLLSQLLGGAEVIINDPNATLVLNLALTVIINPFIAGVEMIGVLHAINVKTRLGVMFSFLNRGSWVAIVALLTSLLVSIGLQFFILPGVVLAILLSLTVILVVEKRMSPWQSIVTSIKALRFSFFQLLQLYGLLAMVLVFAALPVYLSLQSPASIITIVLFFVVLSYLIPMFYHVKGIVYREIFGLQFQAVENHAHDSSSTFDA